MDVLKRKFIPITKITKLSVETMNSIVKDIDLLEDYIDLLKSDSDLPKMFVILTSL